LPLAGAARALTASEDVLRRVGLAEHAPNVWRGRDALAPFIAAD
jgi:hypothetical protein